MSEEKSLVKSLEDLNKALEAGKYTESMTKATPLVTKDELEEAKKYLTPEALNALRLAEKAKRLTAFDINGFPVAQTVYFSARSKTKNIHKAVEQMALIANDLADQGLIHSVLAPISSIQLIKQPGEEANSAAFFFPLVPIHKVDEVKAMYKFSTEEGEIGNSIESLEIEQGKGEFFAIAEVSHFAMVADRNFDVKKYLDETVAFYLKVLPPGTKFLSASACGIVSLSIPYELKFSNPLLERVKRVQLDFVRQIACLEDDKVHEFNLFTGIRYYGEGNEELFKK